MTVKELDAYLQEQAEAFPGQCAYVIADSPDGPALHERLGDAPVPSASTIKTPILVTALEQVRRGQLSLTDWLEVPPEVILPDTRVFERDQRRYTVEELLYWMITVSDNTATNVLLDAVGMDAVTAYSAAIGLHDTLCRRKMLDFAAAAAGRDNVTTAQDQRRLFWLLQEKAILTPALCQTALDILTRQRHMDTLLRYIPDRVVFAHKGGGLDGVSHDCGIFLSLPRPLYVGVFTWEGPSPDGDPGQQRFVGRLGKAIFDTYKNL